jgi:protein involved in polysaccharide export with SLBB domain/capsular polysaccharide biosynthesis protein
MRLLHAILAARWRIGTGAVLGLLLLSGFGFFKFKAKYTSSLQLIRREVPGTFRASEIGESFKPRQLSVQTMVALMKGSGLLQRVSNKAKPPISTSDLSRNLTITPERNTDLLTVTLTGSRSAEALVDWINLYADEVVRQTEEMQAEEASEINKYLKQQLSATDAELATLGEELLTYGREQQLVNVDKETDAYLREFTEFSLKYETTRIEYETLDYQIKALMDELGRQNPLEQKLNLAREDLESLLTRYTESNPIVQEQKERVKRLEEQMASAATNHTAEIQSNGSVVGNAVYLDLVNLRAKKQSLAEQIKQLAAARDAAHKKLEKLPEKGLQFARFAARRQSLEMARSLLTSRQREAQLFEDKAFGTYSIVTKANVDDVEIVGRSKRIITVGIVGLLLGAGIPLVLAALRELLDDRLKTARDIQWTARLPLLARVPSIGSMPMMELDSWALRTWTVLTGKLGLHGKPVIAGFLSSKNGEGRSTVIELLAEAASQSGRRVIAISNGRKAGSNPGALASFLGSKDPTSVSQDPRQRGVTWISIPDDWVWNSENRDKLRQTLRPLNSDPDAVVLIELPPADRSDTVLVAEIVPYILWVARGGVSIAPMVKEQLETIRHSRAKLAGCVANDAHQIKLWPLPKAAGIFGLWAFLMLAGGFPGLSAEPSGKPVTTNQLPGVPQFGASINPYLAEWQRRLTLGPGDVLGLAIYGRPDLSRTDIVVGPDGRINWLQIQDLVVTGLTIDELREKLDVELAKYYSHARAMVTPSLYVSKKYVILGKVLDKGVFTLDRPMTLIEAVARSRGFETGLYDQNTVELADLPRSYLIRKGQRVPVDFERLFFQGDLSQNVLLEPDDFLFFPSSTVNEVYVLGSILLPGVSGFTPNATVTTMITIRGGFTARAFRQRVLVVRGSLNHPQTFAVNVENILRGKEKDFRVEPKDIIYVSDRPWARVEDLLDVAATAFVQSAVITWTGQNIGPIITKPVIPSIK